MDDLTLAAEFPAATRDQWLKLVERVLKGGDPETLVGRTYDGIRIEPLYEKAQGSERPLLAPHGRWRITQRVDHPDPHTTNDLALADLEGGADALTLVFPEAASARGFGLAAQSVDDLDRALRDVKLDLIHLRVEAGSAGFEAAALVLALAERRGHALPDLALDLGLDPIGAMATMGAMPEAWDKVAARSAETLSSLSERGFRGRAFLADGRPYHEAGAGEAQELAGVLATGLAYLRALEAGGHSLDAARNALSFLLVADADQFLTIAKLRALRRLWARIEAACGLEPEPIRLHAETAWRMATRRDPWVNLLRTTVAAFSAGIGGADALTVLPFTAALGLPDAFARRLARNTQLILLEEANLWRVADPAAGAGGFEGLTDALCEHAWGLFQDIEREGGIVASLKAGAVQARIGLVRAERQRAIATLRQPITGTSAFPNLDEADVTVLLPSPLWGEPAPDLIRGAGGGGHDALRPDEDEAQAVTSAPKGLPSSGPAHQAERPPSSTLPRPKSGLPDLGNEERISGTSEIRGGESAPRIVASLPSVRDAEPFERLRDATDAQLARTGARPKVFIVNLGAPADFTAPAGFARTFFEPAGIEAVPSEGLAAPEAAAAAFAGSGAKLACLCSSDHIYESLAAPFAQALREAGARRIYLAGRPDLLAQNLLGGGAISCLFAGCDALAILADAVEAAAT